MGKCEMIKADLDLWIIAFLAPTSIWYRYPSRSTLHYPTLWHCVIVIQSSMSLEETLLHVTLAVPTFLSYFSLDFFLLQFKISLLMVPNTHPPTYLQHSMGRHFLSKSQSLPPRLSWIGIRIQPCPTMSCKDISLIQKNISQPYPATISVHSEKT